MGQRHARPHLVETDPEGAPRTQPVVGRQQQDRPHGDGVTAAGGHDRHGKLEQAQGDLGSVGHQLAGGRAPPAQYAEIEAGAEAARAAGQDHGARLFLGPVERRLEIAQQVRAQHVDLAVIEPEARDALSDAVAQPLRQGGLRIGRARALARASRLRTPAALRGPRQHLRGGAPTRYTAAGEGGNAPSASAAPCSSSTESSPGTPMRRGKP